MAELRGGTTIAGFTALHSGLKEAFLSGNLTIGGKITIGEYNGIFSPYNNEDILFDHNNGNVTLSATGNQLYLGYKNTTAVRLREDMVASNGTTTILGSDGTLYFKGDNTDSRYVRKSTDPYVATDLSGSSLYPRLVVKNSGATYPDWIRIGNENGYGLLPYANGKTSIGTDAWRFNAIHSVNFYENGTALSSKYLGKTAKAADSDKIDGIDSARIIYGDNNSGTINTWDNGASPNNITKSGFYRPNSRDFDVGLMVNITHPVHPSEYNLQIGGQYSGSDLKFRKQSAGTWSPEYIIWNSGYHGAGSGLDADMVDGLHASSFLRKDVESQSISSSLDVGGSITISGGPAIRLNFNRGRSSNSYITWNASSTADYGMLFNVDGNTALRVFSSGKVQAEGTLVCHGSKALQLSAGGSNHTYIEFYARGGTESTARSGYIGYPSGGASHLAIQNEIGEIQLISTGRVLINGNEAFHKGNLRVGTGTPSGGNNGDVYIQY